MSDLLNQEILLMSDKYINDDNKTSNKNKEIILNVIRELLTTELSSVDDTFDIALNGNLFTALLLQKLVKCIPMILKIINLLVKVSTELTISDVKYIAFALIYRYLAKNEINFLYEIGINLQPIFDELYEILTIAPKIIKLSKNKVKSCCLSKSNNPY